MFVSKLSPELWAEARRMYNGGTSCTEIGRHLGMSESGIRTRARREGWPPPVGSKAPKRPNGRDACARPRHVSPGTAGIRSRLAERLYRVIEFRIRMMEFRMIKQLQAQESDPDGAVSPAPAKDEAESFAALIDSINQVTEMASEPAPAADGRRTTASRTVNPELTALSDDIDPDGLAAASEKDALRRDIAERLAKIFPAS